MTATDKLRRLLDERGVEHEGGERSLRWRDRYGIMMQAFPLADGELGMEVWSCTPEQAVAATLGPRNDSCNCTNGERTDLAAENAKLRELVRWMYYRMDESCAVQHPYAPAPINYDQLMQAAVRARELGVEVS